MLFLERELDHPGRERCGDSTPPQLDHKEKRDPASPQSAVGVRRRRSFNPQPATPDANVVSRGTAQAFQSRAANTATRA